MELYRAFKVRSALEAPRPGNKSVKFYFKDVDSLKFASFEYIGSVGVKSNMIHTAHLIAQAESIGGSLHGPLICQVEGETSIRVLKV